jgi:hypothetical protein
MDSQREDCSNQQNNNTSTMITNDSNNHCPYKVKKTNPHQPNQTNCSINIPEFMGPRPIISHHEGHPYFPYSPSHLQNEENQTQNHYSSQQEQQKNQQDPSRKSFNSTSTGPRDDPFCMYKEEHVEEGVNSCQNTLIGKILSNKFIMKPVLHNTLQGIWGNPKGLTITEIEGGFYHITMDLESEIQKALNGNPWVIRNCWFMVKPWDRRINPSDIDFKHAPAWIQLWGLPIHCKTVTMGKHLGSQLGKVEDSALYDYPQKARIVKIKVGINIEEPIRHGMFIGNTRDGINWVDFRYENLPMFCFKCGLIGQNEEHCTNSGQDQPEGGVNPRGPWLRSNIYGKRVHENRDKRFHSNPLQSASGGQFSPIPRAMIEMLAKMKLEEDMEEAGKQAASDTESGAFLTPPGTPFTTTPYISSLHLTIPAL